MHGPVATNAPSLVRQAYEMGQEARTSLGLRVSPFYGERVLIRGRRVDITPLLDTFFFAGFDGEPYPEQDDAVQKQSAAAVPRSSSGEGGRPGEAQGMGAGDGLQAAAREKGTDAPSAGAIEKEVSDGRSIPAKSN